MKNKLKKIKSKDGSYTYTQLNNTMEGQRYLFFGSMKTLVKFKNGRHHGIQTIIKQTD